MNTLELLIESIFVYRNHHIAGILVGQIHDRFWYSESDSN